MTIIERAISYSDRLRSRLYARFLFWRKRRTLTPGLESIQLSKREGDSLEISVRVGCALYCDYCPQDSYVQNYSDKYQNKERVLSEETFFAAMANVPSSTLIKWTGFTEPLASPFFPRFVQHLKDKGHGQDISTTLVGNKESVEWFSNHLEYFGNITLHLPDDSKLMKAKVNEAYVATLDHIFSESQRLGFDEDRLVCFLIGDNFHPDVQASMDRAKKAGGLSALQIHRAQVLNTRNQNIDVEKLNIGNVTERHHAAEKSSKPHYCSYRRLNQGVMLPNGHVALCCQDYNMDFVLGDLKTQSLNELYTRIENDPELLSSFRSGSFSPCNKCEHYVPVDTPFSGHLRK